MLYAYASVLAKLTIDNYDLERQFYILLLRLKLLDLMTKQIHPQKVNEEFKDFLKGSNRQIHLIKNKNSSENKKRSVLSDRIDFKKDIALSCVASNNESSDLENIITRTRNYLAYPIDFIKLQQVANANKTRFAHPDFSSEGRLSAIIYNLLETGFRWPANFFENIGCISHFQAQKNKIKKSSQGRARDSYIRIDIGQDINRRQMLHSLVNPIFSADELEEITVDCNRNPNIFSLHDKLDADLLIKKINHLLNPSKGSLEPQNLAEKLCETLQDYGIKIVWPAESNNFDYLEFLSAIHTLVGGHSNPESSSLKEIISLQKNLAELLAKTKIIVSFDLSGSLIREMKKQLRDYGVPEELFPAIIRSILQNNAHSIHKIKSKLMLELTQMYKAMAEAIGSKSNLFDFYNKVMPVTNAQTPYLIPVVSAANNEQRKFVLRSTFQLVIAPENDIEAATPCADISIDATFSIIGNRISLGICSNFRCHQEEMYNLVTYTFGKPHIGRVSEESIELSSIIRRSSQVPEPCALDKRLDQIFPSRKARPSLGIVGEQKSPMTSPKGFSFTASANKQTTLGLKDTSSRKIKKAGRAPLSPHTPYTTASEKVTAHFYAPSKNLPKQTRRRLTLDSQEPTTIRINAAFFSEKRAKASENKDSLQKLRTDPASTNPAATIKPAISAPLCLDVLPPRKSSAKVISSKSPGLSALSPGCFSLTPTPDSRTPSSNSARTRVSFLSTTTTDSRKTLSFPISPAKLGSKN